MITGDVYSLTAAPYATGTLPLDELHVMYWEQSGNPQGQPAVLLHGGPGAGMDLHQQALLDPRHYRIVRFDQRGAGNSTPRGELVDNTTTHLVEDIEKLREHLKIDHWLVIGGSWGSSLSLAYAQAFPTRVTSLILRGVFLCQPQELDWFLGDVRRVHPEAWRKFIAYLPISERSCPLQAYHKRVMDPDPAVHFSAACSWCAYESACSTLLPDEDLTKNVDEHSALTVARIQIHYFMHGFFVDNDALLKRITRIQDIPAEIIQGRYDMICPVWSADQLHRAWPQARYTIINNAGHAATEPGIRRALIAATERCKIYQ
jgi:proline iminopeptidase